MTWCNESSDQRANISRMIINQPNEVDISTAHHRDDHDLIANNTKFEPTTSTSADDLRTIICPSCGHQIEFQDQVFLFLLIFLYCNLDFFFFWGCPLAVLY